MLLATSVDVEVEIVTDDSASVMQDLTAESVTSELLHRGLPAPESFAAEVCFRVRENCVGCHA